MESTETSLIAHELMLRMLVSNEKTKNPVFAAESRKSVDEFLGRLALDPPNECFVDARAKFMTLLETRDDVFGHQQPSRPVSLRRRFLLWLLHD